MKFFRVLPFLLFLPLAASAQAPFTTFVGGPASLESGVGAIQLPDGSIYVAGTVQPDTSTNTDVFFAKMDDGGNLLWQQTFDEGLSEVAYDFIFRNGAFIIVGESIQNSPFDRNGFILKLDASGNKISYETAGSAALGEQYYGISDADNGFVIVGHISSTTGAGNDVLVRYVGGGPLDSWAKVYGSSLNDIGVAVQQLPGGKFILCGDRLLPSGIYNPFVMVLNNKGGLLYDEVIPSSFNGGSKKLLAINGHEALVIGEMATPTSPSFDIFLAKVDTTGLTQWLKLVPSTDASDAGFDLCQVNSGSFLLAGYSFNEAAGNSDLVAVSVDAEGNEVDRDYFGGPGLDIAYDVKSLGGGHFLACGKSGQGSDQDAIVIRSSLPLATAVGGLPAGAEMLHFYPNPLPTGTETRLPLGWAGSRFTLFSASGQMLQVGLAPRDKVRLDVPPGIYFLKMENGKRTGTGRVVVH